MGENKNNRKITLATKRESERREKTSIISERDSESGSQRERENESESNSNYQKSDKVSFINENVKDQRSNNEENLDKKLADNTNQTSEESSSKKRSLIRKPRGWLKQLLE